MKIEKELSKETVKKLLEKKGKVKGDLLLAYLYYIQKTEGDKGVLAVENRLKSIGVEMKKSEIDTSSWYPIGYEPLIVLAAKENFGWKDDEIFEMGKNIPKLSLITKIMLCFLISIDKVFQESSKYWRNGYDFGELEPVGREGDRLFYGSKIMISIRFQIYNAGYIIGVVEMTGRKGMKIEEKVCTHKGGEYHEYHIK